MLFLSTNGAHTSIGGFTCKRNPMAAVYEIMRQRTKNLHLYAHSNGQGVDELVGGGCVDRIEIAAVERRGILFSQLLWFALSAAGLLALLFAYALFLRRQTGRWSWFHRGETGRYLAWCALLVLPFLGILLGFENPVRNWPWRYRLEYFVYETLAQYLLVVCSFLIALGLILRLRQTLSPHATRPR